MFDRVFFKENGKHSFLDRHTDSSTGTQVISFWRESVNMASVSITKGVHFYNIYCTDPDSNIQFANFRAVM